MSAPVWRPLFCGFFALAAPLPAAAQALTEKSFLEDLPVVLSASRIPQSLAETPGAVTVFDREFIRATGYRDLPSVLKLVPGFQAVTERGGLTQVTYHGLGGAFPNRMQVLVDGRSVYSPYFLGGVDWFAIPVTIDEIERIEVLRGSNSATYGSNAFMGVVNIVTRPAGERRGGEVWANLGNDALGDLGGRYDLRRGDLGVAVNAEVRYDHGLPALVDSPRHGVATVRLDYRASRRDELSLWAGINDSRRGLGYDGDPVNSNGVRALIAENAFVHGQWRRASGPDDEMKADYYHNEEHAQERLSAYLPPLFPRVPIDYDRTAQRDNLQLQYLLAPSRTTRVALGTELRRDAIRAPRLFYGSGYASRSLARVFGNLEWRPQPVLTLNAGAMLERYTGRSAKLAPRLFANWQVVPGHALRIGRSIAYRAPSLFEERADMRFYSDGYSGTLLKVSWLGQPGIRPERVRADELGYLGQFRAWRGVLDVRLFRERITDLIRDVAIAPPPGVLIPEAYSLANSDVPVRNRGFELQYSARPTPSDRLTAGYADVRISAPFAGSALEREFPRHSATLTWIRDWSSRWTTTLSLIRIERFEWSASLPVPGTLYADARIARRFGARSAPAEVALSLFNIGRRHEDISRSAGGIAGNPVWRPIPRIAMLSLRLPY